MVWGWIFHAHGPDITAPVGNTKEARRSTWAAFQGRNALLKHADLLVLCRDDALERLASNADLKDCLSSALNSRERADKRCDE